MFLRRFAGPLLASVKESTGLVGLDVVPNAREVLIQLYNDTLKAVQVIPSAAAYRQNVEKFTQYRLRVCEEQQEWEAIEKEIACGQVEELICQAKDELELIPKMAEWKPWETPEGSTVPLEIDDDPIPAHVPQPKRPPQSALGV
eukprot:TRINITY_DN33055_c0_g1_i1.p1 TRINITY_DN33055_c0_g1~~TRINITY_DN33055_c0_g1_i1.p1  ORF type:complete len:144 (+),score=31.22 TRINITY_DN33055_c0_g1_i1:210-641(+)